VGRRREMRVAQAAAAALGDEHSLARLGEVGDQPQRAVAVGGLLVDERADRHVEIEIGAAAAGAIGSHPVLAGLGGELGMESEVEQGIDARAGDDIARSAVTTVAAAGAAARDEFLAAEREAALSAVARFDVNVDFVYEQVICYCDSTGRMLITRPRAPWSSNRTRPSIFAKIVSSLPRPALMPGRNRRPR